MNPKCRAVVQRAAEAAGLKPRTTEQLEAIERRFSDTVAALERTDPGWQGKTQAERAQAVSERVEADTNAAATARLNQAYATVLEQIQAQRPASRSPASLSIQDRVAALHDDMIVPGFDGEPTRLADFMKAAREEHDLTNQEAQLVQSAADCALAHGFGPAAVAGPSAIVRGNQAVGKLKDAGEWVLTEVLPFVL